MIIGFCVDNTGLGKPINYKLTKKKLINKPKKIRYTRPVWSDIIGITPFDIIEDDNSVLTEELVVKNKCLNNT